MTHQCVSLTPQHDPVPAHATHLHVREPLMHTPLLLLVLLQLGFLRFRCEAFT